MRHLRTSETRTRRATERRQRRRAGERGRSRTRGKRVIWACVYAGWLSTGFGSVQRECREKQVHRLASPQSWVALSDSIAPLTLARTASGTSDRRCRTHGCYRVRPQPRPNRQRASRRGKPSASHLDAAGSAPEPPELTRERAILGAHRSRRPISQVTTQARSTAGTSTTSSRSSAFSSTRSAPRPSSSTSSESMPASPTPSGVS